MSQLDENAVIGQEDDLPFTAPPNDQHERGFEAAMAFARRAGECVCDAYGGCPQGCPECLVCWGDADE